MDGVGGTGAALVGVWESKTFSLKVVDLLSKTVLFRNEAPDSPIRK